MTTNLAMTSNRQWLRAKIWVWCVAITLLQSSHAAALPSLSCQTVQVTDRDSVGMQLGLSKLVEGMKALSLTVTPDTVPSDLRLDFSFSSPGGQITATIRSWAEQEPQRVESGPVPWFEDFTARRRIIQPMKEAEAELFRQQILETLKDHLATRTAGIALGSEPEGLPITITIPEKVIVPFNRHRTVAVLGCLQAGAELEGYVTWADGRRENWKQRANQNPGRFVVGGRAATGSTAAAADEDRVEQPVTIEQSLTKGKPSAANPWRWWIVGLAAALATVAALLLWRIRLRK